MSTASVTSTTPASPAMALRHADSLPLREALALIRTQLGMLALFSLAISVLLLVPTVYMMQVYDRVLSTRNLTTLAVVTVLVLGLYALLAAIEHVRARLLVRLAAQVDHELAPAVFDASFDHHRRDGAPAQRLTADLSALRQFLSGPLPAHLMDAPLAIVFLITATLVDRWLGLALGLSALVLAVLAIVNERLTRETLKQASDLSAVAHQQAAESVRHGEAIAAMGMLDGLRHRWLGVHHAASAAHTLAADEAGRINSVLRFVRLSTQSLALAVGAWLVLENRLSPGMMFATSVLLGRIVAPVEGLVGGWRQFVNMRDAWRRLDEALPAQVPQRLHALPHAEGALSVQSATWWPDGQQAQAQAGSRPTLSDVSFELPAGEALAIMGGSGAGKSTLAKLIAGALTPRAGEVQLDGAAHKLRDAACRARSVGYLPQEVQLFDGTVADNIARMGHVDEAAVVEAARAAGIHTLIAGLTEGYGTRLVPGLLSGGQRQRLGLARALYGQPRLLVLDEPNAHLDDAGERALLQAMARHKELGGTVVVVTHRPSLLGVIDKLLVLREGRLAVFGARDSVLHPKRPVPFEHPAAKRA